MPDRKLKKTFKNANIRKKINFFLLEHFSTLVQQLITTEEVSNSLVLLAVAHEFQPSTGTYFFLKVRVHCHDSKKAIHSIFTSEIYFR